MLVVVMSLDVECCCKDGRTFFSIMCGCWVCVPSLGTVFFFEKRR